jgi:hypothetical protein
MSFSPKSRSKPVSVALFALRTVEVLLALGFVAFLVTCFSGDGLLTRQPPSKDGYLSEYFECFNASQVAQLDFAFKGMFRGSFTLGRAEFKGPVEPTTSVVDAKIKSGLMTKGTYDPAKMTDADKVWLRHQCESLAGGSLPSWFDFPFDRKMRMLTENNEYDAKNPSQPYETVWYFDDERNVVYVLGTRD